MESYPSSISCYQVHTRLGWDVKWWEATFQPRFVSAQKLGGCMNQKSDPPYKETKRNEPGVSTSRTGSPILECTSPRSNKTI